MEGHVYCCDTDSVYTEKRLPFKYVDKRMSPFSSVLNFQVLSTSLLHLRTERLAVVSYEGEPVPIEPSVF
jgi:hypothetical protein